MNGLNRRVCDDCGRVVPTDETAEGPYVDYRGRRHCLACIVETEASVERWWPELKGTVASYGDGRPLSLEEILHKLGLQP